MKAKGRGHPPLEFETPYHATAPSAWHFAGVVAFAVEYMTNELHRADREKRDATTLLANG